MGKGNEKRGWGLEMEMEMWTYMSIGRYIGRYVFGR